MTTFKTYPKHRVIWSEGQLLLPQHFQQLERHVFHQASSARTQLHAEGFGWSQLEIDLEALKQGVLAVTRAQALLPDGTVLDLPGDGRLPPALKLQAEHAGQTVCLALPRQGVVFDGVPEEASWSSYEPAAQATALSRFVARDHALADDSAPDAEPQNVLLGLLSPRLCLEGELTAQDLALPVARLKDCVSGGACNLQPEFIPPLLDLRAHPWLLSAVESLLGLLRHRIEWQQRRLNQPQTTAVLETTDFLMLQSLLRHEAALRFELTVRPVSPLAVLRQLVMLGADLLACGHPPAVLQTPLQWKPSDLGANFVPLIQEVRRVLSRMRERLALEIVLQPGSDGSYLCHDPLPDMGAQARIVIAVQAQVPNDWLWQRFASQVVLCAADQLMDRVRMQMSGVELRHLPTAPAELPLQMGWHYFELQGGSDAWADVVQRRSLAMHVAGQWPGLAVRAWVVEARTGQREDT